jgi:DNA invertase Pin-like site-specific DNA recombinase
MNAPAFVAYYRVSTNRQGASGLGLDAQREAVAAHVARAEGKIIAEFTEVESGARRTRPELQAALQVCKREKAILIIAKLDRLGRNVAFIAQLLESPVEVVAADNPQANRLLFHVTAAFAEHEQKQISNRTRDALAAAKRRGVVLGKHGREVLGPKNHEAAHAFAESLRPVIEELRAAGYKSVRAIADQLNRRSIPPARGTSRWHCSNTHAMLKRIAL